MKKLAIFVSGGGTDMQSIIDAVEKGDINARIECVICSKDGIFSIERCKKHNIAYYVFDKKSYASAEDMDGAIITTLESRGVELIVLAGYLNIVTPILVDKYRNRIINIHPSLIPKYCGMGFYGMKVHRAVIENGEKESGATVHYVDEGADTGAIIRQEKVPVIEGDTPETLQKRVLELEHRLLPEVVAQLCKE